MCMAEKNENIEQAIPTAWRPVLSEIVDKIRNRSLRSGEILGFKCNIEPQVIDSIYYNVDSYDDLLVKLPEDAWRSSICRWMGGYWHLLVDLFTDIEGASDLVLFVNVYETEALCRFEVQSLHVP